MLKWLQGKKGKEEPVAAPVTHAVTQPAPLAQSPAQRQPQTPAPAPAAPQKVRMVSMLTGPLALKQFAPNQAQAQWLSWRGRVNGALVIFADIEPHSELREPEAHAVPTETGTVDYDAILSNHKQKLTDSNFDRHRPVAETLAAGEPAKEFFTLKGGEATTHLGLVPVKEPWRVVSNATFGSWERIADDDIVTAHLKSWYEKYGATPALLGPGHLELWLDTPVVDPEVAADLALEMFSLCPDIIDEGVETTEALAISILGAHVWYFWWDQ